MNLAFLLVAVAILLVTAFGECEVEPRCLPAQEPEPKACSI